MEHTPGRAKPIVTILPELQPYLAETLEQASEGSRYVITRYLGTGTNLRAQLRKITKRTGLEPWPKRFPNLRSTRATELVDFGLPEHAVNKWIGHTKEVADKHYRQVTDEHFVASLELPRRDTPGDSASAGKAVQDDVIDLP